MAYNRYGVANSFTSAFMRGYGFIDDIQRRNRQEKRLEEELERTRARQDRADEIRDEIHGFTLEDREMLADLRQRGKAARALMASPEPNLEMLQKEYSDIPGVLEFIQKEQFRTEGQQFAEQAFAGDPSFQSRVQQAAAAAQGQGGGVAQDATPPPEDDNTMRVTGGGTRGIDPIPTTPDRIPDKPAHITQTELKNRVLNGEMSEEEAAAVRDEQNKDRLARGFDPILDRARLSKERAKKAEELGKAKSQVEWANDVAAAFADINNVDGDELRAWEPSRAVAWYHDNRESLTTENQVAMDKMMESRVRTTLETAFEIIDNPDVEIGGAAFRAAQRQAGQALGIAQAMATERDAPAIAGVDSRGVPRNNTQLVDATVEAAGQGRPQPLPSHPAKVQMDMLVANRAQKGAKLSKAYTDAAYGMLSRGMIDIGLYSQMLNTGAPLGTLMAARGMKMQYTQTDPSKDTWMQVTMPDGTVQRKLVIPARKVPSQKDLEAQARNLLHGDALKSLTSYASTYNTKDDPDRGTRTVASFMADMAANETAARSAGYDFGNILDVNSLYQRWMDFHVLEKAYDRQLSVEWGFAPTFSQQYGSVDSRLFDRSLDYQKIIDEEGLETPGGNPIRITPLKPLSGAQISALQQLPGMEGMSPAQIQEIYDQQLEARQGP